jgi:HK97 family phage major capsid protein
MKTLKALKTREAELKAEGKALLDAADAAGRDLTADEEKRFTAIDTELASLASEIAAGERAAERRRRMDGIATNPSIQVGPDRSTIDPRAGFVSLAEFACAVQRSHPQTPNGSVDPRLSSMYQAHGPGSGYMRESGSNDGYMVPAEFRDRIWELVFEGQGLVNQIDAEPTTSNQVNDLADETTPWGATGIKAFWRAEASQMTATRPSVLPRSLALNELYAFVTASEELLEDAPRLNARLEGKAAEAINWKLDDSIVSGDGVGKPLGYMRSGALVSVAKEAGQAANTLVAANVVKMFSRMLPQGISRAQWRINSDVIPQLATMTLGDQPIWTPPASGFTQAPGGFLLGRPIVLSEYNETLGTRGDVQLIDPKGYYGLKKAGGVRFASSIHLYFDYGVQAFRWTIRFGGQPHLSAPVAPNKGTATKSHFVTLDTRA